MTDSYVNDGKARDGAVTVAQIGAMDRAGLCALWRRVIGGSAPTNMSQTILRRILCFEVQMRAAGKSAQRDVTAVAKALRPRKAGKPSLRLKPGARLMREWNGTTHLVEIHEDGLHWQGQVYKSLSAIARQITGAHWSGPRFFGLSGSGEGL
jgi:hypothetical protein